MPPTSKAHLSFACLTFFFKKKGVLSHIKSMKLFALQSMMLKIHQSSCSRSLFHVQEQIWKPLQPFWLHHLVPSRGIYLQFSEERDNTRWSGHYPIFCRSPQALLGSWNHLRCKERSYPDTQSRWPKRQWWPQHNQSLVASNFAIICVGKLDSECFKQVLWCNHIHASIFKSYFNKVWQYLLPCYYQWNPYKSCIRRYLQYSRLAFWGVIPPRWTSHLEASFLNHDNSSFKEAIPPKITSTSELSSESFQAFSRTLATNGTNSLTNI